MASELPESTWLKTAVDLQRFSALKNEVLAAQQHLGELATELGAVKVAERLTEESKRLADERFRVVVIGEFSNGKSTLINALLGDKILPSSASPTTTVLTLIEGGNKPRYFVQQKDSSKAIRQELSREEFRDLVAPAEADPLDDEDVRRFNEQAARIASIDLALIQYPSALCSEGVQIVDTPGTNDLDALRERITYEFVPNADAVIFVLSGRQILSAKEMDFLKGRILKSDIGRLFFIVNFKDFLDTPEKQSKILTYARQNLRPIVEDPRIYLVCARDALTHRAGLKTMGTPLTLEETGIPEFEDALSRFLESSRAQTKLERPIAVGSRLASELIEGPLNVRRSAIGLDIVELQSKIAAVEPELAKVRREQVEVLQHLRFQLEQEGQNIATELKRGLDSVVSLGVATALEYEGDLAPENIIAAVEQAVGVKHTEQIERAKNRQRSALNKHCQIAEKRMQTAWNDITVKFDSEFKGSLLGSELTLPEVVTDDGIAAISIGGGVGTLALVALAHLAFPVALVAGVATIFGLGSHLEAQRRKKILDEIVPQIRERLSGGILPTLEAFESEWTRSSGAACDSFDLAFVSRIESIESQLQLLMEDRLGEERRADREREECDRIQDEIRRCVERLQGCRWTQ